MPLAGVNGKENTPSSYVSNEAKSIREELEQYFMSATGEFIKNSTLFINASFKLMYIVHQYHIVHT